MYALQICPDVFFFFFFSMNIREITTGYHWKNGKTIGGYFRKHKHMLILCSVFADTLKEGTRPVSISPNGMATEAGIPFFETPGIIFSPLWYPVGTNWVPAGYSRNFFLKRVTVFYAMESPQEQALPDLGPCLALPYDALNSSTHWPLGLYPVFWNAPQRAEENICWVTFPPIRLC